MQVEVSVNGYSASEEIANTVIHGAGLLLSVAGFTVLLGFSVSYGDVWHIASTSIYGATLIVLYGTSTFYHGITHIGAKRLLQRFDHAAIFILIAGTYTPFTLVSLRGSWGWSLFALVWGIAIAGVALELLSRTRYKRLSIGLYLGLGWLIVVATKPMLAAVETGGLILLLAGGLCYSFGVIFYIWKKLSYHHAIWHIFVLAGSALHFFSVFFYVLPPRT